MNVRVEAGPLTVGVMITVVDPTLNVEKVLPRLDLHLSTTTRFYLTPISINGNSISAINPELVLMGGMTTSVMA